MLKLVLGLSILSINAFAVKTADCPTNLTVKASELKVDRTLESVLESEGDSAEEHEKAITDAFENLSEAKRLSATFDLHTAKSGKCIYKNKGNIEKIELYTTRGKDKLYFQKEIGPRGILVRVYATIANLSKEEVELTDEEGGLALAIPRYPYESYDAGGALEFVGKSGSLQTSVK